MPQIQLNEEIKLHYDEFGNSDRILITCQDDIVRAGCVPYLTMLSQKGFHIYAIQDRGMGESTHVFEDYGNRWWEIWADDAVAFANKMGIEKFFYAGVSHGAGIGWYICYRHPERVRGFFGIVAGPHARGGLETSEARWKVIQAAQTQESWNAYVNDMFGGGRPRAKGNELPDELQKLQEKQEQYDCMINTAIECSRINPKKPFHHCKTEEELSQLLNTIHVPILLLGGMRDPIATPETMLRSGRAVPGAKTVLYEAATHDLCLEFTEDIVDDIILFCQQRNLFEEESPL